MDVLVPVHQSEVSVEDNCIQSFFQVDWFRDQVTLHETERMFLKWYAVISSYNKASIKLIMQAP